MLNTLSQRFSADPFFSTRLALAEPRSLTVTLEERNVMEELIVMISYNVRLRYTSEHEYEVVGFDLLREVRGADYHLAYKATPLEWITDPAARAGLDSMLREDVLSDDVKAKIYEEICADMKKHEELANESIDF